MKSPFNWFKTSSKNTLVQLLARNEKITLKNLLSLDEIQTHQEIVTAAVRLLTHPKHSHDGYDILHALASEGDAEAQYILGEFCESTLDQPEHAANWFKRAANQGHPDSQRNYADLLMFGKGVPCDRKQAFHYYSKAAQQGVAEAQFVVGEFYRVGTDIPQDLEKAIHWYELANNNGFKDAKKRIKQVKDDLSKIRFNDDDYSDIDLVNLKLPKDVLVAAEEGLDFYTGRNGVSRDFQKAFHRLLYAAQGGHISAQYGIAGMYFHGQGTNKDVNQAFHWYSEAANKGHGESQSELSTFYFHGVGCNKDLAKAAFWTGKAAENGILDAMFTFGAMLIQGVGITKDEKTGMEYVKMAARKGHVQAKAELKQLGIEY